MIAIAPIRDHAMIVKFSEYSSEDGQEINLIVENYEEFDEQLFHDQMLPVFYRVTPGLDNDSGRLIPGYKFDQTLVGPRFKMSELKNDGLNHIEGISVHQSLLNKLKTELANLGHLVDIE